MSIAQQTARCVLALSAIRQEETADWAEDQLARVRLWADSLGVFASQERFSIKTRLRHNPGVSNVIIQLLEDLEIDIIRCGPDESRLALSRLNSASVEGNEDDEELAEQGDNDDEATGSDGCESIVDIQQSMQDVRQHINRLVRLSNILRRETAGDSYAKALQYVPRNTDGESKVPEFESFIEVACVKAFDNKNDTVDGQDAGPRGATEHFKIAPYLRSRLKATCIRRWRRLSYNVNQRDRLQRDDDGKDVSQVFAAVAQLSVGKTGHTSTDMPTDQADGAVPVRSATAISLALSKFSHATTLRGDVKIDRRPEARTLSAGSMSIKTRAEQLNIPKLPVDDASRDEFNCIYCRTLCSRKEMLSKTKWKDHVLADLEPYICLFEDCPAATTTYRSREAWTAHTLKAHAGFKYICQTCKKDEFADLNAFMSHLRQHADAATTNSQIRMAAEMQGTRIAPVYEACVFCGFVPEVLGAVDQPAYQSNLIQHMASAHLHHFAVMSIPWEAAGEDDGRSSQRTLSVPDEEQSEDPRELVMQDSTLLEHMDLDDIALDAEYSADMSTINVAFRSAQDMVQTILSWRIDMSVDVMLGNQDEELDDASSLADELAEESAVLHAHLNDQNKVDSRRITFAREDPRTDFHYALFDDASPSADIEVYNPAREEFNVSKLLYKFMCKERSSRELQPLDELEDIDIPFLQHLDTDIEYLRLYNRASKHHRRFQHAIRLLTDYKQDVDSRIHRLLDTGWQSIEYRAVLNARAFVLSPDERLLANYRRRKLTRDQRSAQDKLEHLSTENRRPIPGLVDREESASSEEEWYKDSDSQSSSVVHDEAEDHGRSRPVVHQGNTAPSLGPYSRKAERPQENHPVNATSQRPLVVVGDSKSRHRNEYVSVERHRHLRPDQRAIVQQDINNAAATRDAILQSHGEGLPSETMRAPVGVIDINAAPDSHESRASSVSKDSLPESIHRSDQPEAIVEKELTAEAFLTMLDPELRQQIIMDANEYETSSSVLPTMAAGIMPSETSCHPVGGSGRVDRHSDEEGPHIDLSPPSASGTRIELSSNALYDGEDHIFRCPTCLHALESDKAQCSACGYTMLRGRDTTDQQTQHDPDGQRAAEHTSEAIYDDRDKLYRCFVCLGVVDIEKAQCLMCGEYITNIAEGFEPVIRPQPESKATFPERIGDLSEPAPQTSDREEDGGTSQTDDRISRDEPRRASGISTVEQTTSLNLPQHSNEDQQRSGWLRGTVKPSSYAPISLARETSDDERQVQSASSYDKAAAHMQRAASATPAASTASMPRPAKGWLDASRSTAESDFPAMFLVMQQDALTSSQQQAQMTKFQMQVNSAQQALKLEAAQALPHKTLDQGIGPAALHNLDGRTESATTGSSTSLSSPTQASTMPVEKHILNAYTTLREDQEAGTASVDKSYESILRDASVNSVEDLGSYGMDQTDGGAARDSGLSSKDLAYLASGLQSALAGERAMTKLESKFEAQDRSIQNMAKGTRSAKDDGAIL